MPKKYQEQYCKKHNQYYASYLPQCPICRGEKMSKSHREAVEKINEKLRKIK